jgi:hypothetical protein
MQRVLDIGCSKVAALGEHAVHSMQIKRIAGESHMKAAVFHDEEDRDRLGLRARGSVSALKGRSRSAREAAPHAG